MEPEQTEETNQEIQTRDDFTESLDKLNEEFEAAMQEVAEDFNEINY